MTQLFVNNGMSTLAAALTAAATTLSVQPGQGARFPSPVNGDFLVLTLFQMTGGIESNYEIVKVTSRSVDTLTIVRAQEGTTAQAYNVGDQVSARNTAGTLSNFATSIAGKANLAGNAAQNFAAKDMTAATFNGGTLGMRNRIINGNMAIDQRNNGGTISLPAASTYAIDRFTNYSTQAGKLTQGRNASGYAPPSGVPYYLGTVTAVAAVLAASDYFVSEQAIEGYNVADLGWGTPQAKPIVLSFLAYATIGGTYSGAILNSAGDRSYAFSYALPANTWTQTDIAIPGDTTGTWIKDNGVGMRVRQNLGCGTNTLGAPGVWTGSLLNGATGSLGVVTTANAAFLYTNLSVIQATTPALFEFRPYGLELALCQRYYEVINMPSMYTGTGGTAAAYYLPVLFKVQKRSSPTIGMPAATDQCWDSSGINFTPSNWTSRDTTSYGFTIWADNSSPRPAGIPANTYTANAEL